MKFADGGWQWVENPNWHVLIGETYLQTKPPIDPESPTRLHRRLELPIDRHTPEMAGNPKADDRSWFDLEVQGCELRDIRLLRRFASLLEKLSNGMGQTIPLVCQDWASTKAGQLLWCPPP